MMRKSLFSIAVMLAAFSFGSLSADAGDSYQGSLKDGPIAAASYDWTGFYLGFQGGYGWGQSSQFFTRGGGGTTGNFDINGGAGGGTLGYNWQSDRLVYGIETDISGSRIDGSTHTSLTYGCGTTCATTIDAFGTLRGRVGYAWDNVLLYGTGGWAYGEIESNLDGGTDSHWRNGWTAGAGVEYAFHSHWTAKLEWIYTDLGSFQWTNATNGHFSCTGLNCSTDATFNVIRAGFNYKF